MKAALRTDGNSYQVELEVSQPLDEPIVALYWSPGTGTQSLAGESPFWGRSGTHRVCCSLCPLKTASLLAR